MHEILTFSGRRQALLIQERKLSSVELVQAHLERICTVNPAIHAAVEVLAEDAMEAARTADHALACGQSTGPLHGVPFSVKDSIEVAGKVSTAGTLGRAGAPPAAADATLVARLRGVGAIPIARTNLPELLFAFESDNFLFGRTNNPYDPTRTSGGSSGGEAALIAACGSPMGLGSDAAGSVRLPGAFCGIAALKPTTGSLARTGHFPPSGGWIEALWQMGPMARHVEDLSLMMALIAGPDGQDASVVDMPFADPARISLKDLRVAFHTDNGFAASGADVTRVVQAAARALETQAAAVTEARPECLADAYDLEMKLLGADGGDSLRQYLAGLGTTRLHPLLTGWLDKLEPYRTGLAGFQRYWSEWDVYRAAMAAFLRDYDVILSPVYTEAALPHGVSTADRNFKGFSYTMAYNVAGWPAAVVRCGETVAGLPVSVQIAAGPWREDIVLAVAGSLEKASGGWKAPA